MKKYKKGIAGLITMIAAGLGFVLNPAVDARTEQISDYEIRVDAQTPSGLSGSQVTVDVYEQKDGADKLVSGNHENNIKILVYHDQFSSGANGNLSFVFKMDRSSGTYKVCFGGGDSPKDEIFEYVSKTDYDATVAELIRAFAEDTADNTYTQIEKNRKILGLGDVEGIEDVNLKAISNILYEHFHKNPLIDGVESNRGTINAAWKAAVVLDGVNRGIVKDITAFDNEIGADGLELTEFWQADFVKNSAAMRMEMTEIIGGQKANSFDEFHKAIRLGMILATAHRPDGAENLRNVLTKWSDTVGVSVDDITLATCQKIMGTEYNTVAELKKAIENAGKSGSSTSYAPGNGGGVSYFGGGNIGETAVDNSLRQDEPEPLLNFTDLDDVPWAKSAIQALNRLGIVNGRNENTFCPNEFVTREEFVKMAVLAFLGIDESAQAAFMDVHINDWFYPYVARAAAAGIVKGYQDGSFGTGEQITRQDLCVMVYRIGMDKGVFDGSINSAAFEDVDEIAGYAAEAVGSLSQHGIVNGVGDHQFAPRAYATRAEAAKILYGLLNILSK